MYILILLLTSAEFYFLYKGWFATSHQDYELHNSQWQVLG